MIMIIIIIIIIILVCVCCVVAVGIEKPAEKVGLSGMSPLAAPPSLQQATSSSQSGFAKSLRELPLRYRRKPLDQTEIEYIQVIASFLLVFT